MGKPLKRVLKTPAVLAAEKAAEKAAAAAAKAAKPSQTFTPTDEQRNMVKALTGFGILQEQIRSLIKGPRGQGISDATFRKNFREEIATGATTANAKVAESLFKNATVNNNVSAQIWWSKTRMGWKEPPQELQHGGIAGGPPINIIVRPSN